MQDRAILLVLIDEFNEKLTRLGGLVLRECTLP